MGTFSGENKKVLSKQAVQGKVFMSQTVSKKEPVLRARPVICTSGMGLLFVLEHMGESVFHTTMVEHPMPFLKQCYSTNPNTLFWHKICWCYLANEPLA